VLLWDTCVQRLLESGESHVNTIPPYARFVALGMAVAAAIGLLLNHFLVSSQNAGSLVILAIGPLGLFLGVGGAIEPKILWSMGKYGADLPAIYKVIGFALGLLGLLVTGALLLFVYGFGPAN
jgi:hypothetical protein